MWKRMLAGVASAAALCLAAVPASATVIISTLPEFNGDGSVANTFIGTFAFVIPTGEEIVGAQFESSFGNSLVSSTAVGSITVDGLTVATCGAGDPCFAAGIDPILYVFGSGELAAFADGLADLYYNQTGCCRIRLGESTLTITTRAVVPEPATWAMMITGFALAGAALRRRRAALA